MKNIFTSSKKEADEIQNLLDKNLPNYRKSLLETKIACVSFLS